MEDRRGSILPLRFYNVYFHVRLTQNSFMLVFYFKSTKINLSMKYNYNTHDWTFNLHQLSIRTSFLQSIQGWETGLRLLLRDEAAGFTSFVLYDDSREIGTRS